MPTLNWIGKDKVVSHHQDVPYKVLEHKYGFTSDKGEQNEPTNSGNKIIHGDNLEALKSLLPEYEGKIKCIYIDPPDRKSTRLNSSHVRISYAVFCLKKKKKKHKKT